MKNTVVCLLLTFFILPVCLTGMESWKKEFSKKGVTVYTRTVSGSDIREFRGICMINADIETVNNALSDIPNLASWMPDCLVSKVVKKKSDNNYIIYQVIKTPWPLDDRDFTFETKIIRKGKKIIRTVDAVPYKGYPPVKKYVRIKNMTGRWILSSVGNKTHAVYQIKTDPAGNIPVSIANSSSKDLPYKTMIGLRKQVKRDKYKSR